MKTLYGSNFKMHLVLDEQIIPTLSNDLQNRFGEVIIEDEKPLFVNNGKIMWDTGGSIIGNDVKFCLKISDDLSLICRSQHWDIFKKSVLNMFEDKKSSYLKLHSHMYVLVLNEEQSTKLLTQIIRHSEKLDQIADVTTSRIFNVF